MSEKLDRFTKRARSALTLAQKEAIRLNHSTIDTEDWKTIRLVP
jgi:hypothetical protein